MPRSTLAPNPRKATPHTSPTSRKNQQATAAATLMLYTRSPLSESFRPWGETLVLVLENGCPVSLMRCSMSAVPTTEAQVFVSLEKEEARYLPEGPRAVTVGGRNAIAWV